MMSYFIHQDQYLNKIIIEQYITSNNTLEGQQPSLYWPNEDKYSTAYSVKSAKPDRSAAHPSSTPSFVARVYQQQNHLT